MSQAAYDKNPKKTKGFTLFHWTFPRNTLEFDRCYKTLVYDTRIKRNAGIDFYITVLLAQAPSTTTPPISSYITRVASSHPSSISFLPLALPPHKATTQDTDGFHSARLNNPLVHNALSSLSRTSSIRAFVLDFFCTESLAIAQRLLLPSYFFLPFGTAPLTTLLYFPTLHRRRHDVNFKDLGFHLDVPGFPHPSFYRRIFRCP